LIVADYAAQKNGAILRPDPFAPLRAAQARLDAQQAALDQMQLQLRQVQIDLRLSQGAVQIVSIAGTPEYPVSPRLSVDRTIGIIAGIVLGIVAATLLELALWFFTRLRPPTTPPHPQEDFPKASSEY
jgi:hypothetical protein